MNQIQAIFDKSDYEIYCDFLNFRIDGCWLDEKLDEVCPGNAYKGLVPTLLFWMEQKEERKIVWKRIYPKKFESEICPILMCPDDCDFSCTIIVAEIKNCDSTIKWLRLGIDQTKSFEPEKVGSEVKWFDNIPPFEFSINDYSKMIEDFKTQYNKDEVEWRQRREDGDIIC